MRLPLSTAINRTVTVAIGALLSACTNVALQAINVPSYLADGPRAERDIAYGERGDQKLDLYLPPTSVPSRRQMVVFIYGGAWTAGARADYFFVAQTLSEAGYAVAIPDYIKYPQGVFPDFVTDVAQSIGWLADNIDAYAEIDQFILMGHSAGAHTGALLVTDHSYLQQQGVESDRIGAFVGLAGPYGFKPEEQRYKNIFANLEDYSAMRPLHFASGAEPPMLLIHGSSDSTVLPVNTEQFALRVNSLGGDAQTRFYDGVGHIAPVLALSRTPLSNERIRTDILDFLDQKTPAYTDR